MMTPIDNRFDRLVVAALGLLLLVITRAAIGIALPDTSPISVSAYVPPHLSKGAVITLPSEDRWVVSSGSAFDVFAGSVQPIVISKDSSGAYQLTDKSGTVVPVIPMPDPAPIASSTYIPSHLGKGAVITLPDSSMWVVSSGSAFDVYGGNVQPIVIYTLRSLSEFLYRAYTV